MRCPTVEEIVETNKKLIKLKKITKAERHELLAPREEIQKTLEKSCGGKDVYDNAAKMLKGLNQGHFFGSANKRTSLVSAMNYLRNNNKEIPRRPNKEEAKFMLDVREGRASVKDIKRWLKS